MIRVSIESRTLHLVVHSWASWFHREFVLLAALRRFPGVLHLTSFNPVLAYWLLRYFITFLSLGQFFHHTLIILKNMALGACFWPANRVPVCRSKGWGWPMDRSIIFFWDTKLYPCVAVRPKIKPALLSSKVFEDGNLYIIKIALCKRSKFFGPQKELHLKFGAADDVCFQCYIFVYFCIRNS